MKFKVGDKVRCTKRGNQLYGRELTVRAVDDYCADTVEFEGHPTSGWYNDHFELIQPAETDLERLVRVANEGIAALAELNNKHRDKLNCPGRYNLLCIADPDACRIEIKPRPKPIFPELYVGAKPGTGVGENGWKVTVSEDGKTVSVGCQNFDRQELRNTLRPLLKANSSAQGPLVATREGVQHPAGKISWADADKLLKALEEFSEALAKHDKEAA